MIIDSIENFDRYRLWEGGLREAVDFLRRKEIHALPPGWHEVVPASMRASVSNGPGRRRRGSRLETHRKHIDLQFIISGTDRMGWKPRSTCHTPHGEYDETADVEFFDDQPDLWFTLQPGMFVIFFPEDAHMPQICSGMIHKVVVKLPITGVRSPWV
jgi:biofilm protein TabA